MVYYDTIKFGFGDDLVELEVVSMTPSKSEKTLKQFVGRVVSEIPIMGTKEQQWNLSVRGVIASDDIVEMREKLLNLDDAKPHPLEDGVHDGNYYIVPGSLSFSDDSSDGLHFFRYSMRLVEV